MSSLAFGDEPVGSSKSQTLTILNSGNQGLAITTVTLGGTNPGDFSQTNTCANITLQPDASCTVTVTFTPTAAGADNAGGSPQTVSLSGSGGDFAIAVTPANGVSLSPGQQATYTVTLTPVGSFSQAVAVRCADAPQLTTCSLSSNGSVTLNGTSPSSLTMTVATTAPSATGPGIQRRQPPVNLPGSPLLWLAGFSLAAMAWNCASVGQG